MRLSIIIGIVDGGAQLERCLVALASQRDPPALEVIVPWDDTLTGMDAFETRYPSVRFAAMGHVPTSVPATHPAGLHELYDRRRAAGLHLATGDLVAMLEDRSVPDPDWARSAVRVHVERPNLVIGGTMADGRTSLVGHADYLCDFYRYQPPQPAGPREYVSNVNICYKREALDRTRALWTDAYYDLSVHWALQREGEQLWLAPELRVSQQRGDGTRLSEVLNERLAWGRRFAARRASETTHAGRLRFALQAPLVPLVLWARAARAQRGPGALVRLAAATPAMLLIFTAWGVGELLGSLTGRP